MSTANNSVESVENIDQESYTIAVNTYLDILLGKTQLGTITDGKSDHNGVYFNTKAASYNYERYVALYKENTTLKAHEINLTTREINRQKEATNDAVMLLLA